MILNEREYKDAVLGCWMGKNIGGTLGAPFEWKRQFNSVQFYTQELGGEPLPNDDLDIQLLWLIAIEQCGVEIDAHILAEYWMLYVTPNWSEYGIAKANMRAGLVPPLCGTRGNAFKDSCGAYIRSEIWACIAPGDPHRAARAALQDAMLDHGDGEGTLAEVFFAAIESAAFVEKDLRRLIEIGLSFVPESSGVAGAVRQVIGSYDGGLSWRDARDALLREYRGGVFWNLKTHISPDDVEKGFFDGQLGWDAPSNIGITVLGLLYGQGDFGQTLCIAVNCGEDTDCTAASAGALFGILHGAAAIPERWMQPIGRSIKTLCLNLGELGFLGSMVPQNVDELTTRTLRIAEQGRLRFPAALQIGAAATDLSDLGRDSLFGGEAALSLYARLGGPVYRFHWFEVYIDYGGDPTLCNGTPKTVRVQITNLKTQAHLQLRWLAPAEFRISPTRNGSALSLSRTFGPDFEAVFQIQTERVPKSTNYLALQITIEGRPTALSVPIVLLDGNLGALHPTATPSQRI